MLWEIEIHPVGHLPDREAARVASQCRALGLSSIRDVRSARSFLVEGDLTAPQAEKIASTFLADTIVETFRTHTLTADAATDPKSAPSIPGPGRNPKSLLN
ncbi:MAG: phosphoribosylformylglycinamidine synthase subunit PurS, partial [Deltaproteobacteria bacterium]